MPTFSDQVNNGPVIFSLLKMIHTEVDEFGSTQSATQQDRQHCMVALPSNLFDIWGLQERFGLFCGEPISESDANLFCSILARHGFCCLTTYRCNVSGDLSR